MALPSGAENSINCGINRLAAMGEKVCLTWLERSRFWGVNGVLPKLNMADTWPALFSPSKSEGFDSFFAIGNCMRCKRRYVHALSPYGLDIIDSDEA